MAYNQDEVTKKLKINLRGVDPDDRRSVLEEIGEFVVDSILDRVGEGKSPVEKEKFKKLSKEYAEREKSGDRTPNLDLFGDMLDALDFQVNVSSGEVEIGIFDSDEAAKAFGHNTGFQGHPTLKGKGLKRRFIPRESQRFDSEIRSGIRDIIEEFKNG